VEGSPRIAIQLCTLKGLTLSDRLANLSKASQKRMEFGSFAGYKNIRGILNGNWLVMGKVEKPSLVLCDVICADGKTA
jgi:hypothetical protein